MNPDFIACLNQKRRDFRFRLHPSAIAILIQFETSGYRDCGIPASTSSIDNCDFDIIFDSCSQGKNKKTEEDEVSSRSDEDSLKSGGEEELSTSEEDESFQDDEEEVEGSNYKEESVIQETVDLENRTPTKHELVNPKKKDNNDEIKSGAKISQMGKIDETEQTPGNIEETEQMPDLGFSDPIISPIQVSSNSNLINTQKENYEINKITVAHCDDLEGKINLDGCSEKLKILLSKETPFKEKMKLMASEKSEEQLVKVGEHPTTENGVFPKLLKQSLEVKREEVLGGVSHWKLCLLVILLMRIRRLQQEEEY
ncbi:hypothetical protein L2E82_04872 [Cichorium intybus]|uniref:Uncharacterized protein n=1 Tax=Cichorium intybus TaxID=13427 RepID=A0ACB9H776_CICIN|nr:hypothetical protein L2E82_04872 [Cichorium intybus]